MPEPQKSKTLKSSETSAAEKAARAKAKSSKSAGGLGSSRALTARVERSLKDVDRLLKKNPGAAPQEKVMAHLEQAKVSALLELAEAIRGSRRAGGPPQA
jgi:hypothetical protein